MILHDFVALEAQKGKFYTFPYFLAFLLKRFLKETRKKMMETNF